MNHENQNLIFSNACADKEVIEDNIVLEMVEIAVDFGIIKITELASRIYNSGIIPEKIKESEFIIIPRKEGAVDCSRHRTISIMSLMSKIILKMNNERLKKNVEKTVGNVQLGFRKGLEMRNSKLMLRTVMERAIEKKYDL